ncbi:AIR synthase-related protein (plasmid) [Haloferax sp. S1W]|uniref:AIR synthase-related protein n=1 Tax=Haloferax sp. S1W TaxID=3377110 RepID=UPI0037C6DD8E
MAKFSPTDLDHYVFSRTGARDDRLRVGARYAEDAAAVSIDETTLVISSDPISLAAARIGTLGVAIASNDIAACGGRPEWLVSTILLPEPDIELLDDITAQLDAEAERLGISIVGGHTETVSSLSRPLLSLTCMGPTDRYVPTAGAEHGDVVLLTKGAGIEGTGVLATDFRADLDAAGVESATIDRAIEFFDDISVLPESAVLAPVATSMHDPTEGGVLNGLVELACASGVQVEVESTDVPIRPETQTLCAAMDVDPLRVLGSGALLATVPRDEATAALAALETEGIEATAIGRVDAEVDESEVGVVYDGRQYATAVQDDMYTLWD